MTPAQAPPTMAPRRDCPPESVSGTGVGRAVGAAAAAVAAPKPAESVTSPEAAESCLTVATTEAVKAAEAADDEPDAAGRTAAVTAATFAPGGSSTAYCTLTPMGPGAATRRRRREPGAL